MIYEVLAMRPLQQFQIPVARSACANVPVCLRTPILFSRTASTSRAPPRATPVPEYKGRIPRAPQAESPSTVQVLRAIPEIPKDERTKDERYKSTFRRVLSAMCAAPIAIVLTYVMYQRLVLGVEQKKYTIVREASE
ncbi:hypothetical protein AAFC00_000316 [Neodothiora populina]|uniref:Transmembrane protein n=1 Tax=Neodothiora populina TaxID=2781224 RepID=A0ABR3PCP9_9PEZI